MYNSVVRYHFLLENLIKIKTIVFLWIAMVLANIVIASESVSEIDIETINKGRLQSATDYQRLYYLSASYSLEQDCYYLMAKGIYSDDELDKMHASWLQWRDLAYCEYINHFSESGRPVEISVSRANKWAEENVIDIRYEFSVHSYIEVLKSKVTDNPSWACSQIKEFARDGIATAVRAKQDLCNH